MLPFHKEEASLMFENVSASGRTTDESKYKTELCKNWIEKGYCSYGGKCRFAHGVKEIKSKLMFNYLFRSKPCFEFHEKLHCMYGVRCLYYHSEHS